MSEYETVTEAGQSSWPNPVALYTKDKSPESTPEASHPIVPGVNPEVALSG
jgi:hypothetical protein